MSLIDRYILREWLKALFLALMLILGILILEDMYKYLKIFLEKGASVGTLLLYYLFVIPNFLHTVLPIAFFISVLFVLNEMQAHNEIVALRATGLTVFKITRSFWYAALVLALSMVFFTSHLLPYSADKVKMIVDSIEYNHQKKQAAHTDAIGVETFLTFYHAKEHRLWFMSRFSFYTYRGFNVTLSQLDPQGKEQERIEAKEIRFDDFKKEWIFLSGRKWTFNQQSDEPVTFENFKEHCVSFSETPRLMKSAGKALKNLNLGELELILKTIPEENERFLGHRVKYYSILSSPLICFIIVLLAVPFSLKGVRANPMVGISEAAGLFFFYYLLSSFGRLLGTQGTLTPFMAAWVPNLLMLGIGLLFYRQLAPK